MSWFSDNVGGFITALIPGLTAGAANYLKDDPTSNYANTQAGFEATLALKEKELAQQRELAMLQLAKGGGGGGANHDALLAAQLAARVNLANLREKGMADQLSLALQGQQQTSTALQNANNTRVQATQNVGNAGSQGYGRIAQILQGFRT